MSNFAGIIGYYGMYKLSIELIIRFFNVKFFFYRIKGEFNQSY